MKKITKILIPATIIIGGIAIMLMLFKLGDKKSKRGNKPQIQIVDTKIVSLTNSPAKIVSYGRVKSVQPIQLYSDVSGNLLKGDITFQPAESFNKGDLLLKIDSRQTSYALKSAKSELLSTLALFLSEIKINFPEELNIWQEYFNNCSFENDLNDLPQTDNQKIKIFLARLNVYKLFFAVRDLEVKLTKHFFYAPFDGAIVTTNQRVGSSARNGTLLGEIINLEQLEVVVPISVSDIQWINSKKQVKLYSSELKESWTGQVSRIGKVIDSRTQTIQVIVSLNKKNSMSLYEGLFFEVEFEGQIIENSFSVPHKAVYNEEFVYLIEDGKLKFKKVEIARKENSSVMINGGLTDGDILVVEAMQGVYEGMPAKSKLTESKVDPKHE